MYAIQMMPANDAMVRINQVLVVLSPRSKNGKKVSTANVFIGIP